MDTRTIPETLSFSGQDEHATGSIDEENPHVSNVISGASADNNGDSDDDDDDNMTIIGLDATPEENDHLAATLAWLEQNGPEMERRRRNILLRELERVQRASFIHFILLCLIPTALLLIVITTVFSDEEECGSDMTRCIQETRTFVNAFTTRCICDAIDVHDGEGG